MRIVIFIKEMFKVLDYYKMDLVEASGFDVKEEEAAVYGVFYKGDTDEEIGKFKYVNGESVDISEEEQYYFPAPAEQLNSLSRNDLYTGHQKQFSVSSSENEDQWTDVIPELVAKYSDFSVCLPIKDPDVIIGGIYINGSMYIPPILSGEYFDSSTTWADSPKMVIGKKYEKDVYTRDGMRYYEYDDEEYEVIGIMGTEEDSRINRMILMDFQSAVRLAGINTEYVLDTKKEAEINDVGRDLFYDFRSPAAVSIILNQRTEESFISRALSSERIVRTMYMVILISFSLSTVLVTIIWLRFRRQLFFAWTLCGYETRPQMIEIAKRYFRITGIGFVTGLGLMYLISQMVLDIRLMLSDAVTSFVITLFLGTVVLVFHKLSC